MRKSVLLTLVAAACVVSMIPSHAATSSSSSGGIGDKMKNGAKAVGRGIMWGPKKIGAGFNHLMHPNKKSK